MRIFQNVNKSQNADIVSDLFTNKSLRYTIG